MSARAVAVRCQSPRCGKWLCSIEPQTGITSGAIVLVCPRCKAETIIGPRPGVAPAWMVKAA